MPHPPLWLILVGLFVADVLALIVVALVWGTPRNTFQFELAKGLLQAGLVVVLGAALSLLIERNRSQRDLDEKLREEDRELREYREEFIKTTLGRATSSYSALKRARRLMRALAIIRLDGDASQEAVLAEHYDAQMFEINSAQLEFENLAHDVKTSASLFSDAEAVRRPLKALDSYLSRLVTEYETQRRHFAGDPARLELERLPLLAAFLEPRGRGGFVNMLVGFRSVQEVLRRDLAEGTGDAATRAATSPRPR